MKKLFLLSILFALNSNSVKSQLISTPNEFKQTAMSFLKWYLEASEKPENLFDILQMPDTLVKSSAIIFRINFNEVRRQLDFLKSSGYLSNSFIKSIFDFRKMQDSIFLKYLQPKDKDPIGFGYDLVLQRMEMPEYKDTSWENPKITSFEIKDSVCKMDLQFPVSLGLMKFKFEKCENKWLVSEINDPVTRRFKYYPSLYKVTQKHKPI